MAILRPIGGVVQKPVEVSHDGVSLQNPAYQIKSLGEDTRVLIESTGRYHEPVAAQLYEYGILVSVPNPCFRRTGSMAAYGRTAQRRPTGAPKKAVQ